MSAEELRAAAEQVIGQVEAYDGYARDWEVKAGAVAEAYLAEHPEDGRQTVTAEWLKAKGFINEDADNPAYWVLLYSDLNPALTIDCEDAAGCSCAAYIGHPEDGIPWPHDIHVRRQVYDLSAALGVPLTEAAR